jgi:hypothetical protein
MILELMLEHAETKQSTLPHSYYRIYTADILSGHAEHIMNKLDNR